MLPRLELYDAMNGVLLFTVAVTGGGGTRTHILVDYDSHELTVTLPQDQYITRSL